MTKSFLNQEAQEEREEDHVLGGDEREVEERSQEVHR
jgi:hypothetical protein